MRKPNSGNGSHSPWRALYGRHRKHVPFRRFYNFCRNILYKQRVDQDLDQEIRSYLDLLAEEKARSGMGRDEALQQARRELGGVEQIKENVRDVRVGVSHFAASTTSAETSSTSSAWTRISTRKSAAISISWQRRKRGPEWAGVRPCNRHAGS